MYASFRSVTAQKRQNSNPHPDGKIFVDLNGLGILRDERLSRNLSGLVLTLSPPQRPLFIVGRAGEREKESARGTMGRGNRRSEAVCAGRVKQKRKKIQKKRRKENQS